MRENAVRRQRSEDRGQGTEDREQRTEVRGSVLHFLSSVLCLLSSVFCSPVFSAELVIDDFEAAAPVNKLGGNSNTYVMEPSRALALRVKDQAPSTGSGQAHRGAGALMLKYDKKGTGGPHETGGWCGYYTLLKSGSRYFDVSGYSAVSFWVKGAAGGENFVLGVVDQHWDEVGDSVKSEPIGIYLPAGKLTTEWQKAVIPLDTFLVDMTKLASLAICFEGSVFPNGVGKGTVYLDDLMLE